jgi:hypothetical protein
MGKGGSTSNTSTYSPPPEVSAAYKGLISGAERLLYPNAPVGENGQVDVSNATMAAYPQYTPAAYAESMGNIPNLVAPYSPNMTNAGNTIAGLAGYAQPYVNAGTGLALAGATPIQLQQFSPNAINQYMSPYINNVLGSTVANINETNAQQQQQLLGNLIQKGAFGGDRTGVAQGELARQQGLANNATIANILNSGYGQALGEFNTQQALDAQRQLQSGQLALSAAPLLANLGGYGQSAALQQAQAQYGYGTGEQQQRQAELSTGYQNFLNKSSYPYQQLGWLGGLVSGAASGMGGTTTSSIPQPGAANQIIGGLGALGSIGGLGNLFGGGAGAAAGGGGFLSGLASAAGSAASGVGSGIGSILTAIFGASDERLKENIQPVGKTFDGQNIYKYNFKSDPKKEQHLGLMAQEVEKHHPDAVAEVGGIKMVNYDAATKHAAHRGHFAVGGPADLGSLAKASPVAGMAATNPFPSVSMQANPHMPQTPNTKPESLDTAKLKDAVQGIKSLMGKPQGVAAASDPAPFKTPDQMSPDMQNMPLPPSIPMEARGGLVGHYDAGGIVIPQGMMTKDDVKNYAEMAAGSGASDLPGSLYAVSSEDLLGGKEAYRGGLIMKDDGGPVEGGVVERPALDYAKIAQATLPYIAQRENAAGNPDAKNPNSSASGLYQITDPTHRAILAAHPELGDAGKNDPRVATAHITDLARNLHQQGFEPSPQNIRMSYFLGQGGGPAFLKQMQGNPDAPAYTMAGPDQVRANQSVFFNSDGTPRTAAQVYNVLNATPAGRPVNPAGGPNVEQRVPQTPGTVDASRIPMQSPATKEGLFGALGIAMTPEQRLASFQAFAKLAGTPGKFGVGLAAAADTYAKTLLEAQGQTRQTSLAQAQAERERAGAQEAQTKALTGQFQPGPAGFARFAPGAKEGEVQITAVDMPDFGKTATIGANGSQTQTAANATEGGVGAPAAPGAPSAAAPKIEELNFSSLAGGQTPEDKIKVMQDAANGLRGQAWGTQAPENMKIFNEMNTQARQEGVAAANNRVNMSSMINAITQTPSSGFQTRGAGKELRDQVANYLNTAYRGATGADLGAVGDNLSNEQILSKLSALQTQGAQKGLGREAGFWLKTLQGSFPSGSMSEGAAKEIMAAMIVDPRQALDRASVYDQYGKLTKNMGKDADQVFNKVNSPDQYAKDKSYIKELLMDSNSRIGADGKRQNMVTDLMGGKISRETFDKVARDKFGVQNLSRYFIGG